MPPLLIVLLPFLGALLPGVVIRSGRGVAAWATALPTMAALIGLGAWWPVLARGEAAVQHIAWLPQVGLSASFRIDGLSAFFAALILGIGLIVTLYTRHYLAREDGAGRFFTMLLLFQGAMTGLVLSNNLLGMLVFWELTSLSSFLLIGYWTHREDARRGARMSLTVTAFGGLAMIAGMLILGHIAGSLEIDAIIAARGAIAASPLRVPAMVLILTGAFAKSAQIPFHFWLPRAMAAPTPVSAYLHSATMVKAGLYLMARLWPVFAGQPEWFWIVGSIGLLTMLMAAAFALTERDLKGLLAWSTVSHLGLVTMLLGIGTVPAAVAAMLHILNHALFKAPLFLVAGIVEHQAHSRDLRDLGGLGRRMPITFAIGGLAALSMAGVPFLGGFLSKEMMLEQALATRWGLVGAMPLLATLAAVLSAAYSFRFVWGIFMGRPRAAGTAAARDPRFGFWAGPALLVAGVVVIGVAPMLVAPAIARVAGAVTAQPVAVQLAIWHGINAPLGLSAVALIGGALLLWRLGAEAPRAPSPFPDAGRLYWGLIETTGRAAARFGEGLQRGSMAGMLGWLLVPVLGAGLWMAAGAGLAGDLRPPTPVAPVALIGWLVLMAAAVMLARRHSDRLVALILTGIIGLMISLGFAWLSAPDLALTQVSVEVVTIVLMLLMLNFLPRHDPDEDSRPRKLADIALAGASGLAMAALCYAIMRHDFAFPTISAFHAENSYLGGGGHNIVNVILVDFRGYDTFGEITVLGIAGLTIYALARGLLAVPGLRRAIARSIARPYVAGDAHPLMMAAITRLILPLAVVLGIFIFLRGHNAPGGGFVAGLVISIALLMQYMALGFGWAQRRVTVAYHALIGAGVSLAAITGIGAWVAGRPFMTSDFGYLRLPGLEPVEWATAALFDLGVFLTVLGAVMLALASLARLGVAVRADREG